MSLAGEPLANVLRVLGRFRRNPEAFLGAQGLDLDRWMTECVVLLSAGESSSASSAAAKDSDAAKLHVLQLWQEYAPLLFVQSSKRTENIFNSLFGLMARGDPTDANAALYSQVVMTLTSVVVVAVNAPKEQPKLLAALVNKLLDFVRTVNSPVARVLRSVALQSLMEIERAYPAILASKLGLFMQLAQEDLTHLAAQYVALVGLSLGNYLRHIVVLSAQQQQHLAPLSIVNKGIFALPDYYVATSGTKDAMPLFVPANANERQALFVRDANRCITFLVENAAVLGPAQLHELIHTILAVIATNEGYGGVEALKNQFMRLSNSHHPTLVHAVLSLRSELPKDKFTDEEDRSLLQRVVVLFSSVQRAEEERLLVAEWLLSAHELFGGTQPLPVLLHPVRAWFYPTVFDSLRIKQAKLKLLANCFQPAPSPIAPPSNLLDVLTCLKDFQVQATHSMPAKVYFDSLLVFLKAYPELSGSIQTNITDIIFESPRFIEQLSFLTERIRLTDPTSQFPISVLRKLSATLCECDVDDFVRHGFDYIHLLDRIATEADIDPVRPSRYLLDVLRLSAVCELGSWSVGVLLIKLIRTILLHHPTSLVFHALRDLLAHMAEYYADVDVRDQAKFLLLILTHLSREKMLRVLAPAKGLSLDFSVDGLSAGPSAYPKVQPIQHVPVAFLSLVRASIPRQDLHRLKAARRVHTDEQLALPLREYLGWVSQLSQGQVPTTLDLVLRYDDVMLSRKDVPAYALRIFSVILDLVTTVPVKLPVKINVPYLEAATSATALVAETIPDTFPYQYSLPVEFVFGAPSPAWFTISAEFNTGDGVSQRAPLEPLRVGFEDLLLPVADSSTTDPALTNALFRRLWSYLGVLADADADADADGEADAEEEVVVPVKGTDAPAAAYESVKYLVVNSREMVRLVKDRFEPFLVPNIGKKSGGDQGYQDDHDHDHNSVLLAMFFVPPRNHILCKFAVGRDSTVVSIRTDAWRTLTYLDNLLEALVLELPDDQVV